MAERYFRFSIISIKLKVVLKGTTLSFKLESSQVKNPYSPPFYTRAIKMPVYSTKSRSFPFPVKRISNMR